MRPDGSEHNQSTPDEHPMGAWLRQRLTGPKAKEEWSRLVAANWNQLTATPLGEVVAPQHVQKWIHSHLENDRLSEFVVPIVQRLLPSIIEQLRNDTAPVGRWVPDTAHAAINHMVSRRDLIHEDWIRALFREQVVEVLMADVLYCGIRDFSTVIPRLILNLMPTARFAKLGGAGSLGKKLVEDLEKRLEPEIKAFLKGGTKSALARAADYAVDHRDDDVAIGFRRNVVQFVLSQSPSFHVHAFGPELLEDLGPIVDLVARHVANREETRQLLDQAVEDLNKTWGQVSFGEALENWGMKQEPDLRLWAEATWPSVVKFFHGPVAVAMLDELVCEFLEEHARRS